MGLGYSATYRSCGHTLVVRRPHAQREQRHVSSLQHPDSAFGRFHVLIGIANWVGSEICKFTPHPTHYFIFIYTIVLCYLSMPSPSVFTMDSRFYPVAPKDVLCTSLELLWHVTPTTMLPLQLHITTHKTHEHIKRSRASRRKFILPILFRPPQWRLRSRCSEMPC